VGAQVGSLAITERGLPTRARVMPTAAEPEKISEVFFSFVLLDWSIKLRFKIIIISF